MAESASKSGHRQICALFVPNLGGGGAERVLLAEAKELIDRGHEVDVILAQQGGALVDLIPPSARLIELKAPRLAASLFPLVRYLRQRRPDALHASMWPVTVIAILAHRLARSRARLMVSDHTVLSRHVTGVLARWLLRWTTRRFYPRADVRTQCSRAAADDLARLSNLPAAAIEVIHSPIERPAVIASNPRVEALWNAPNGARILTVGTLKEEKNHALLIKAFARLSDPDARLMIVGEGPVRPEIKALARSLGVADRVILPGFELDPWPFYASADLFVLSSDYEGFGMVLAEAMAAGLRIVSTDCPFGPAELTDYGRYGLLTPCGDVGALAAAMETSLGMQPDAASARARAMEISGPAQTARIADLMTAEDHSTR